MFLIDAIKHTVEKKFKTCFIFSQLFRGCVLHLASVQNKTSMVSFRAIFSGGNKNFIQKKRDFFFIWYTQIPMGNLSKKQGLMVVITISNMIFK